MNIKRITPVLLVKEIEPVVPFWVGRLGFTKTIEVPDGNKIGFVAFQKGSIEVMYQTRASVVAEDPSAAKDLAGHSVALFITVDDIDAAEQSAAGAPVVKKEIRA